MIAKVDIMGTQLPLHYELPITTTVRQVKQILHSHYAVPFDRQTLHLFHGGKVMQDNDTLASYDDQLEMQLLLNVAPASPRADAPIRVFLMSQEFPDWMATVRCKETTTMGEFRRLAADQLRWATTDGMELYNATEWTRLDRDERSLGCVMREFLVFDGSVVWVQFTSNVPQNGTVPE